MSELEKTGREGTGQETRNQEGTASAGPVESAGRSGSAETTANNPGDNRTTEHNLPRKRKPGNPAFTAGDNVAPGDNARFIRYALVSWDLPPIDISDPEQVKNRILEYFNYCAEHDRKPQMIGMANWLGVDRDTLNNWKRGVLRSDTHLGIIKKALALLEEQWIDYMQSGKVNPAAGIFLAKNWYGYRDVQDVVVTPTAPYEAGSAEDVAKQYIDGMVGYETVDSDGSVE